MRGGGRCAGVCRAGAAARGRGLASRGSPRGAKTLTHDREPYALVGDPPAYGADTMLWGAGAARNAAAAFWGQSPIDKTEK